ncbi:MAG: hypothetical protein ACREC5_04095, partial [Thermoplasmata archaeon]
MSDESDLPRKRGYRPDSKFRDAVRRANPQFKDAPPESPGYWEYRGYSVNDSLGLASETAAKKHGKPGGYRLAMDGEFHPVREADRIDRERLSRPRESRARAGMSEKWSKGVHPKEGVLRAYGWSENAPAEERRRALERSVKQDGYATTVDRLDFMRNVANRENNRRLSEEAHTDLEWLRRWERVDEDDHQRSRGEKHQVET